MGYIKHHSIIVTSPFKTDIETAHNVAKSIFKESSYDPYNNIDNLITGIFEGIVNSCYTFFIVPDGSKEGWNLSDQCDEARNKFLTWMHGNDTGCDYIEIEFGGDDPYNAIVKSS
jgi:hypothetical protein